MEVIIPSRAAIDFDFNSARSSQSVTEPSTPRRIGDFYMSAPTSSRCCRQNPQKTHCHNGQHHRPTAQPPRARLRGIVFNMDGTLTVPVIDFAAMYRALLGEDEYVRVKVANPTETMAASGLLLFTQTQPKLDHSSSLPPITPSPESTHTTNP